MKSDSLISLVMVLLLIIVGTLPVYSQDEGIYDSEQPDEENAVKTIDPTIMLENALLCRIRSKQIKAPPEYVRYNTSDYTGKSIESFSYVIWNDGDAHITSINYKIIIKDLKGKILFSKAYQYNKPLSTWNVYDQYGNSLSSSEYPQSNRHNKSESIVVYLDKPIKSKWSMTPQNHILKLAVISFTIDNKKTSENISRNAAKSWFADNDYSVSDYKTNLMLEQNFLWSKILELSPNFRTDEHEKSITDIIKFRLQCTKNGTLFTR